jgi:hypothetical protein
LRRSTGEFVVGACDGEKAKGRKAGYCHAIVMPATALPAEKTWRPIIFPLLIGLRCIEVALTRHKLERFFSLQLNKT